MKLQAVNCVGKRQRLSLSERGLLQNQWRIYKISGVLDGLLVERSEPTEVPTVV